MTSAWTFPCVTSAKNLRYTLPEVLSLLFRRIRSQTPQERVLQHNRVNLPQAHKSPSQRVSEEKRTHSVTGLFFLKIVQQGLDTNDCS